MPKHIVPRRLALFGVAVVSCVSIATGTASALPPASSHPAQVLLAPNGLGVVSFGATASLTERRLTAALGKPTGHPSAGCTGQYTQAAWNDLITQFVAGRFRGYRYLDSAHAGASVEPTPAVLRSVRPRLATSTHVTLGSTLAATKAAYPALRDTATDSWQTSGITFTFYASGLPTARSKIYEIKNRVCPASI